MQAVSLLDMPKRILIILHGSIGDVVRALPLVNLLRDAYPEASITWAVEPAAFPVIDKHPSVDRKIVLQRNRWWCHLGDFLGQVRGGEFDLVLDLQRHLKSGLISWWSGAPKRVGFHRRDSKEGNWLFNNRHIPPVGEDVSKLDHYLRFAEFLGIRPAPVEWRIAFTREEEARVSQFVSTFGDDFAVFFVGARWESKRWFPYETALCAAAAEKRFGLAIVLVGASQDVSFARRVEGYGLGKVFNCVAKLNLRETMLVLKKARVAVGPDTGPMHLAAALGTPVVSLWGATNPSRTGPFGYDALAVKGMAECSPCYLRRCAIGRLCMRSITVESVLAKVAEALEIARKSEERVGEGAMERRPDYPGHP